MNSILNMSSIPDIPVIPDIPMFPIFLFILIFLLFPMQSLHIFFACNSLNLRLKGGALLYFHSPLNISPDIPDILLVSRSV